MVSPHGITCMILEELNGGEGGGVGDCCEPCTEGDGGVGGSEADSKSLSVGEYSVEYNCVINTERVVRGVAGGDNSGERNASFTECLLRGEGDLGENSDE